MEITSLDKESELNQEWTYDWDRIRNRHTIRIQTGMGTLHFLEKLVGAFKFISEQLFRTVHFGRPSMEICDTCNHLVVLI